jgi:hypothetical protein
MLWTCAIIAMVAVAVTEQILVSTNKAWWCKDGRVRRGGYTDSRYGGHRRY